MQLGGLIKKEFGRIKSDKRTLVLLFFIPLILIIIFGLVTGGGPTKFFTASIITRDSMPLGQEVNGTAYYDEIFISTVRDNCSAFGFHSAYNSTTEQEYDSHYAKCLDLLKNGVIGAIIILPENFTESVENATSSNPLVKSVNPVLIYAIDGSDIESVNAIKMAIQEPLALFRSQVGMLNNFTTIMPSLEFSVPFWESQMLNYALGLMLPLIIIGTTMNLTSLSIVSEGPLARMMLTPTAKNEIILSKTIANIVIMTLQATEIFVMLSFFGLYCLGSLFDFYATLLLTGLCGISIGLFISALATTEQAANQMYLMFFIVLIIFSGMFGVGGTDEMKFVTSLLPLGYSKELIVSITLRGAPMNMLSAFKMVIISLVFLLLAYLTYRFKKVEV
ncbi:MAG: ABC transporter permease [Candidatus Lokiarchaeota archaeon]|nr:ABC transporter permease [Candidatus Lokiarchaeota archaeon]